jgi:hypothetical protein
VPAGESKTALERALQGPGEEISLAFGFANAVRITKVISGLKTTSALRTDRIPVAVLKMGSDTLAGPILHMVNMSLSAGVFPSAFKTALIHPVYKGGGKARNDPASYRPVAILCALSKVLDTVAKEDPEAFMKANDILPASQHGFGKGRSCTTALATAHAARVSAKAKVVSVIGFDLSAAFDTVGREDLLPKMSAMGIGGKALRWFRCYLTDAKQRVVWDGQVSDVVDVEYGVGQGSLPGPVLYLLHVFDLPLALEIRESDGNSGYNILGCDQGYRGGAAGTATACRRHGEVHQEQRPRVKRGQDPGDDRRQGQGKRQRLHQHHC